MVGGAAPPPAGRCPLPLCPSCVLSTKGPELAIKMRRVLETLHTMQGQVKLMWMCYFDKAIMHPGAYDAMFVAHPTPPCVMLFSVSRPLSCTPCLVFNWLFVLSNFICCCAQ